MRSKIQIKEAISDLAIVSSMPIVAMAVPSAMLFTCCLRREKNIFFRISHSALSMGQQDSSSNRYRIRCLLPPPREEVEQCEVAAERPTLVGLYKQ